MIKRINSTNFGGYAIFTVAVLAIVYARHGYEFGTGDQSETSAYVLWLNNHHLYPFDFYLQNVITRPLNERRFFVEFLNIFSYKLNYGVFFLHAIGTAGLLWGIYYYSRSRFNNFSATWLAIILPLLIVYIFNTGGSELYDDTLNPSYIANILAVWVFILIDRAKVFLAFLLLIIATFFQPLIGALLTLIIFISEITKASGYQLFQSNEGIGKKVKKNNISSLITHHTSLITGFVFYCFTAGIYVYSLAHQISSSENVSFSFQIVEMRQSHHYFPHHFKMYGYIFMLVCVAAIFLYGSSNEKIWSFYIVAGCLFYTFGVYVLKSNLILNTQWFRITIWIKLWGTLLLTRKFLNYIESDRIKPFLKEANFKKIVAITGLVSIFLLLPLLRMFKMREYMFPFFKNTDAIVEIAEHAKNATPIDALFITPPNFEPFRYYSQRSNFIDFKALHYEYIYFKNWYERINSVYGLNIGQNEKGYKLMPIAIKNYNVLSDSSLFKLCKQNNVGYIIRDNSHPIFTGFNKIDSTAYYSIYSRGLRYETQIKKEK